MSRKSVPQAEPVSAPASGPVSPAEVAARDRRWQAALAEAEAALAAGEAQDAERRAKALSAIAKAAADISQWKQQALAASAPDETDKDGETFRRELELRINRVRREQGLDALFDEDPVAP